MVKDALDKIPSRVKYYLLEYRDRFMDEFISKYGRVKLRSLTEPQLIAYFQFATAKELQKMNELCQK